MSFENHESSCSSEPQLSTPEKILNQSFISSDPKEIEPTNSPNSSLQDIMAGMSGAPMSMEFMNLINPDIRCTLPAIYPETRLSAQMRRRNERIFRRLVRRAKRSEETIDAISINIIQILLEHGDMYRSTQQIAEDFEAFRRRNGLRYHLPEYLAKPWLEYEERKSKKES